eukprot:gene17907-20396_t
MDSPKSSTKSAAASTTKPLGRLFDWARPKKKYLYMFNEGSLEDKNALGLKGANLCEMVRLNLPVPPGFIIASECCIDYLKYEGKEKQNKLSEQLIADYKRAIADLEIQTNKKFGGEFELKETREPLLLAVRAGAAVNMPNMMDTVLNVGINDQIVDYMTQSSMNPKWAYDTYRRFLQMFGNVVLNMDLKPYEDIVTNIRKNRGVEHDSQLTAEDFKEIVKYFKLLAAVPDDPWEQLYMAIEAVFRSWTSPRAVKHCEIHNISCDLGTAVTVQSMVYGNLNDYSGAGVAYTRNPITGEKKVYGEYLINAMGEDVRSGVRAPSKLTDLQRQHHTLFDELEQVAAVLERNYIDMQEILFTIENKKLFVLQTRTAKRTPRASVQVAVSMVKEKMITEREALLRVDPNQMDFFLHSMLTKEFADPDDVEVKKQILCRGTGASAGAATGEIVFTSEQAQECKDNGQLCILVCNETSPKDMDGLHACEAVLTLQDSGIDSYAARMARVMRKSAVVNANKLSLDLDNETLTCTLCPSKVAKRGDIITIDGSTGYIYFGDLPKVQVGQDEHFRTVMQWADKYKRMGVLASVETLEDVQLALRMGAEGIGLCTTEHMFYGYDRLDLYRRVILAPNLQERSQWLLQLLPLQQHDFLEIFRLVGDTQVTIRLLDPPMHEFLPDHASPKFEEEVKSMAEKLGLPLEQVQKRLNDLKEENPMLGFRGCRLSIAYPEITEMQTKAIVGAAIQARQDNISVKPQIMIPFIVSDHEVSLIIPIIDAAAHLVCNQHGGVFTPDSLELTYGAMIQTPRAVVRAERIAGARLLRFVSVGTNELTQLAFGTSQDQAHLFMPHYLEKGLLGRDPFVSIDAAGVGSMVQDAVRRCQREHTTDGGSGSKSGGAGVVAGVGPPLQVGICGDHTNDPYSIAFLDRLGVDYVSCSPYRIPIAKVAAAQAHIQKSTGGGKPGRMEVIQKM